MKLSIRSIVFFAPLLLPIAVAGCRSSGSNKGSEAAAMPTTEEMMAIMAELGTPDENHRRLEPIVGDFRYVATMWMTPGEPPTKSEGTSSNHWALGNLYVESSVRGTFMGSAFEGRSFLGYDKSRGEYAGIWIGSDSSCFWPVSHGTASADGKTITMNREKAYDAMLGTNVAVREVLTILDRDHHTFQMYTTAPKKDEMKVMEIAYTRIR